MSNIFETYEYWASLKTWYLEEAACLSLGITPKQHGGSPQSRQEILEQHKGVRERYAVLQRAHDDRWFEKTGHFGFSNWSGVKVIPTDVIEKAPRLGFDFPKKLINIIKNMQIKPLSGKKIEESISKDKSEHELKNDVYDSHHPRSQDSSRYIFQQTGPTWKIVYQGREIAGLKGAGFAPLGFLIFHPRKDYHTDALYAEIYGENVQVIEGGPKIEFPEPEADNKVVREAMGVDHVVDEKTIKNIKLKVKDLKAEIAEAEANHDLLKQEALSSEYDELIKYSKQYLGHGRKKRQFRSDTVRKKDAITKSLERAINKIEESDELAGKHFRAAFQPLNSFTLSYRPDRDVKWTDK